MLLNTFSFRDVALFPGRPSSWQVKVHAVAAEGEALVY